MKRRRSNSISSSAQPAPKKIASAATLTQSKQPCPLLQILQQYGLLEAIAAHIFPKDLFALAATSKAAYKTIFLRPESRACLLNKMKCDGRGIKIRNEHHKKSRFFYKYPCIEHAKCGSDDQDRDVETRSCSECGVTTCDECRIHAVYQSITMPPPEDDDLPTYSGFVLLDPQERGILSPAHVRLMMQLPWKAPYHDQGFLELPLESDRYARKESVELLVETDLADSDLWSSSSLRIEPLKVSPVTRPFWELSQMRKRALCNDCFSRGHESKPLCNCSIRSRFLDRWLCLGCYCREIKATKKAPTCVHSNGSLQKRTICTWCKGEIFELLV